MCKSTSCLVLRRIIEGNEKTTPPCTCAVRGVSKALLLLSASPKHFSHTVVVYGAVELPTSFCTRRWHNSYVSGHRTHPDTTRTKAQLVPRRTYPDTVHTQTQLIPRRDLRRNNRQKSPLNSLGIGSCPTYVQYNTCLLDCFVPSPTLTKGIGLEKWLTYM